MKRIVMLAATALALAGNSQAVPTFEQTQYEQNNWQLIIFYDPADLPTGLTEPLQFFIDGYLTGIGSPDPGPSIPDGIHFDWYVNTPFDDIPASVFAPGDHTPSYIITYSDMTTEEIFGVPFHVDVPTGPNPYRPEGAPDAGATAGLLTLAASGTLLMARRTRRD